MGFLSDITDTVFGGTDDTALKEQRRANTKIQEYAEKLRGESRDDIMALIPDARESMRQSNQEAIQVLRRLPLQQNPLLREANYNAQLAARGGAKQAYNAIMGNNVNWKDSRLMPKRLGTGQMNADAGGGHLNSAAWMTEMPDYLAQPQANPLATQAAAGQPQQGQLTAEQQQQIQSLLGNALGGRFGF